MCSRVLLVALAAVVAASALAAPALAGPGPSSEPAPSTVATVTGTCLSGGGTLTLRQKTRADASTRVTVSGHDVADGRWRGYYSQPAQGDDSGTHHVSATATDGHFATTFTTTGPTSSTTAVAVHRSDQCSVLLDGSSSRTMVTNTNLAMAVSYTGPGELEAWGLVQGCERGTTWKVAMEIEYEHEGAGIGSGRSPCRHGLVRIQQATIDTSSTSVRPQRFQMKARSSDGEVRRISYRFAALAGS